MPRKPIPVEVQTAVLLKSRRRCCICYGLNRDLVIRQGQLAHLDQDPEHNSEDNIAFICLDHHDWYDTKPSQSKGLTIGEVTHFRSELYEALLRRDATEAETTAEIDPSIDSVEPTFEAVPLNIWTRSQPDYPDFLDVPADSYEAPRIFLTDTIEEILNSVRRMPPLSREIMARAAYVGRWIRCRATIFSVDEGDKCYRVWTTPLDNRTGWSSVSLTYPLAWRPDVEALRSGDRIHVEGRIHYVASSIELVYPLITEHWRQSER